MSHFITQINTIVDHIEVCMASYIKFLHLYEQRFISNVYSLDEKIQ